MKSYIRLAAATLVTSLLSAGGVSASPDLIQPSLNELIQSNEVSADRLLVKFRASTSESNMLHILQAFNLDSMTPFYAASNLENLGLPGINALKQWRVVSFANGVNLGETFQSLKSNPSVESIVPDIRVSLAATPNDLDDQLWGLNNTGQYGGTYDADVDAIEAWDTITDASNVVVAVIDTGIDYTHVDLAGNIWTNEDEIPGNGIDDDNNGYIDDIHGYDFVNNDGDPMDDHFHGTHVMGTIAAQGNNGSGISGIAWNAQVMALKFLDENGNGFSSDAINAVLYAANNGAVLSNNSWGSYAGTHLLEVYDAPLKDAIKAAGQAGHLFIAAAGNNGANTDGHYSAYPAGIALSNILTVAATDRNDEIANFSNYGEVEVDLAAPGVDIYSTMPGNQYDFLNGTSMAAPHVAGAAALLFAMNDTLSPEEAKAVLMNTADALPNLAGIVGSSARLNIANAVAALAEGPSCTSYNDSVVNHVTAGRAHYCGFLNYNVCADGSDEDLGSRFVTLSVELVETATGYFQTGTCQATGLDLPPVITMDGEPEKRILVGASYSAPSATATDREDGSLNVSVSGSVNTSVAGDYVISYNATDSAGNSAATERRLVQVLAVDTAPDIVLFGDHCRMPLICFPMYIEQNTHYVEPGYIAVDELDGDLTSHVQVDGSVINDTSTVGKYEVHYNVVDSAGQFFWGYESIFRLVFVLDAEYPHIFLESDEEVSVATGSYTINSVQNNAYAMDMKDKYQSTSIENGIDNTASAGTYVVRYHYTDTDGYTAEAYQTIHVVDDITPPTISLNGDAVVTIDLGENYYDPWIAYSDDLDPYPNTHREGTYDTNTIGTYSIRYWVEDESGNTSENVYRTINVVNPCSEYTDTNSNHISAGRAYACGSWNLNACASGSGNNLGSQWSVTQSTIHETDLGSGVFYSGACQ
ncbi:MAG: S8 family serine peptidase [Agarilytica sp.]